MPQQLRGEGDAAAQDDSAQLELSRAPVASVSLVHEPVTCFASVLDPRVPSLKEAGRSPAVGTSDGGTEDAEGREGGGGEAAEGSASVSEEAAMALAACAAGLVADKVPSLSGNEALLDPRVANCRRVRAGASPTLGIFGTAAAAAAAAEHAVRTLDPATLASYLPLLRRTRVGADAAFVQTTLGATCVLCIPARGLTLAITSNVAAPGDDARDEIMAAFGSALHLEAIEQVMDEGGPSEAPIPVAWASKRWTGAVLDASTEHSGGDVHG